MSAPSLLLVDDRAFRRRTGRTLVTSTALHAVFLAWLVLKSTVGQKEEALTIVSWVEPTPVATPLPPATAPELPELRPEPEPTVVTQPAAQTAEHFERPSRSAEVEPSPQIAARTADALASRAASLRENRLASKPGLSTPAADVAVARPSLAGAPAPSARTGRIELTRSEGTGGSVPVSMNRGPSTPSAPRLASASVPTPRAERTHVVGTAQDSALVRDLAGARLLGPAADRPLVSHQVPVYPEWAKREGIEGSVSIRFLVRPDGGVRDNVLVERTSGFEGFDSNATTALLAWQFEPLSGSTIGDQWGVITFNYRLSER